jgi:hypothetical protein
VAKKKTLAQNFQDIFRRWTNGSTPEERATGEKKADEWLKRQGKSRLDISAILAQAAADDAAAAPPPPPSDPRDTGPHPFNDPAFTVAGVVEGMIAKYVTMGVHERVIFALWTIFTHAHERFTIAPRIALVSEEPDSGKSVSLEIARKLVRRPNPEALGTGAAIADFLDDGPGTVLLDELDHAEPDAQRRLRLIWNLGHNVGRRTSMMVKGRRKLLNIGAPMLAAGIGGFLASTQKSRTYTLDMEPYTNETRPERDFYAGDGVEDLDIVYSYLRQWANTARLDPKPTMPPGVIRRFADNARGLISIADSCGPRWAQHARAAVLHLLARETAERPHITIVRHGLVIFDALDLDMISSVRFNRELKHLDLPDARWTRYRGASGTDYAHPIAMHEQAALLGRADIRSVRCRPGGSRRQFRGYTLEQFEEAARKHSSETTRGRLHLIVTPASD